MVRSFFGRRFEIGGAMRLGRDLKARPRRLMPSVDGLETRALMTGSVTLSQNAVIITPDASLMNNSAVVSYQQVGGVTKLDVNLNGIDNYFDLSAVAMVQYAGCVASGTQSFTNQTGVTAMAVGGTGTNDFNGGEGTDIFVGGSGVNNLTAGSGNDVLIGGLGTNAVNNYSLSSTGSAIIIEEGSSNNISSPTSGSTEYYIVL